MILALLLAVQPVPPCARHRALVELTRVDQAYGRIRHPTARQTVAYDAKIKRLSSIICPKRTDGSDSGMNDDDGNGNVSCD